MEDHHDLSLSHLHCGRLVTFGLSIIAVSALLSEPIDAASRIGRKPMMVAVPRIELYRSPISERVRGEIFPKLTGEMAPPSLTIWNETNDFAHFKITPSGGNSTTVQIGPFKSISLYCSSCDFSMATEHKPLHYRLDSGWEYHLKSLSSYLESDPSEDVLNLLYKSRR
jgi:hypothetical protein